MAPDEAERLCGEFLARARTPLPPGPPRKAAHGSWRVRRALHCADLAALDELMRRLLEVRQVGVIRLARALGADLGQGHKGKTPNGIHERWCIFKFLRRELAKRRGAADGAKGQDARHAG